MESSSSVKFYQFSALFATMTRYTIKITLESSSALNNLITIYNYIISICNTYTKYGKVSFKITFSRILFSTHNHIKSYCI